MNGFGRRISKYPRFGQGYKDSRGRCRVCGAIPTAWVAQVQQNWFRGDDSALCLCEKHKGVTIGQAIAAVRRWAGLNHIYPVGPFPDVEIRKTLTTVAEDEK